MRPALVLVLVAQAALPAAMLVDRWAEEGSRPVSERPASFQMYSATGRPAYTGVTAQGERPLDEDALPPLVRAVGTGRTVPDRLCARDPALLAVRRTGGPDPGAFPC